uniref:Uncharacterized protein n=1 Tax=Manihot esculenta TaxID=3983 RepID=A0A2C9W739_MANES
MDSLFSRLNLDDDKEASLIFNHVMMEIPSAFNEFTMVARLTDRSCSRTDT